MCDINTSRIPFDILETIIDIVASADDHNLTAVQSCSLTNHTFLHLSRSHIFKTITIESLSESASAHTQIPRLFKILSTTPSIASYTRYLTIRFGPSDNYSTGWFPALPNILKLFTGVQHLTFGGATVRTSGWDNTSDWTDIPPLIQDAIKGVTGLQTITSLSFEKLDNFPLLGLPFSHNIRRLGVFQVDPSTERGEFFQQIQLQEFFMGYQSTCAVNAIMSATQQHNKHPVFDFSQVRKFYVRTCADENMDCIRDLLKRVKHLETIHITVVSRVSLAYYVPTLLLHMSTLTKITIDHVDFHEPVDDPASDILSTLIVIGRLPNIVEEFEFSFYQPYTGPCALGDGWTRFDDILVSKTWPCLKSVTINITPRSGGFGKSGELSTNARRAFLQHFPLLSSSNVVSLNVTLRDDTFAAWTEWS